MIKLPPVDIQNVGEGEIEINAELEASVFDAYWPKVLKNLGQNTKIDGFRPGHIPENILIDHLGEDKILWEMAEQAIGDYYPAIIQERKLAVIGNPQATITKLAKNNPLGFKIRTAVMPEIKIGDYKKIAQTINQKEKTTENDQETKFVSDEEINKVIEDLRLSRNQKISPDNKESQTLGVENPPPIDDAFAQSLGQFKNLEELKAKIKENLILEKEAKAKEKNRIRIVEEVIKASDIKIAELLIDSEKEKMLLEMEMQIKQMGLNFEDYLTHLKKTKEDLRKDWTKNAKQRVAFGLVLAEIAKLEKIEAPTEELKKEIAYLEKQYPEATEDRLRSYATGLLINEKVFQFLEDLSEK